MVRNMVTEFHVEVGLVVVRRGDVLHPFLPHDVYVLHGSESYSTVILSVLVCHAGVLIYVKTT